MFWSVSQGSNQMLFAALSISNLGPLMSNSDEKEVFGEMLDKLDQALYYNGDLQSLAGNENPREYLPSICFSVQKCDKAVQVSCGLSQTTKQRLETVILGHCGGLLLMIANISQTGHGSVNFPPVRTFFWMKFLEIEKLITLIAVQSEANQFQLCGKN